MDLMISQVVPNIISEPCFGDSTPSESSPMMLPVGANTPTSSPLTLGPPLITMGNSKVKLYPNHTLNKIARAGCNASLAEEHQHPLDELPLMSYQRNLPGSNAVPLTVHNSFKESPSSNADACLQQILIPCEHKTVPGLRGSRDGETKANRTSSCADLSKPPLLSPRPFESGTLAVISPFLGADLSQASYPDIVRTPPSSTSQENLALRTFSSKTIQARSIFSHGVNIQPCEQLLSTLVERFKSTGGHSDDILSRTTFNGENEDLKGHTNSTTSNHPKCHSDTAMPPRLKFSATQPTFYSNTSREPPSFSTHEHDTLMSDLSLTLTGQLDESHDEAGTGCVSEHFNVPSSSPIAQTEYSQSNPYFIPAIISRAHNPDLRPGFVGIQELVSSSPPSSPSMTSGYLPSSSPIPSSSPVVGQNQTPPSSPPPVADRYVHDLPRGIQEPFYANETYSQFPDYALNHSEYHSLPQHDPNNFYFSTAHQHSNLLSESLAPPQIIQEYYNQMPEASEAMGQYAQNGPARVVALEPQPIPISGSRDSLAEPTPYNEETIVDNPKRQAPQKNVIPNPKRPTLAGVRLQQKKLSKPFRSPIIHPPVRLAPRPPTNSSEPLVTSANSAYLRETVTTEKSGGTVASSSSQASDSKIKHRTARAASQFKSPLSASSTSSDEADLVRLTPTIQSLERKLQLLRRALKVREDVQEEVLDGLVDKWSKAGREVAWEVWDLVKENGNSDAGREMVDRKGKKRAVDEGWGWDDSRDPKKQKADERNWGWDVVPVLDRGEDAEGEGESAEDQEETNEEERQPSVGTMLMQLGIAPETLGWNEEEGTFVEK